MNRYQLPLAEPSALTDSRPAGKVLTSREAFRTLQESGKRRTEQERVLDLITARGGMGATSHEVCEALGLGPQSVSARLNELYRAGYIGRRGDRRGAVTTAFVWRWMGKAK